MVVTALLLAIASLVFATASASAATGYELDPTTPSRSLGGSKVPHGIAVDQANQRIYVAILVSNPAIGTPGEIDRFESNLTASGVFSPGGGFYGGVAVNPLTQGFYAAQALVHVPQGDFGTARMDLFSSSGSPGTTFPLSDTGTLPQIATDSSGDVYYPNAVTHKVQVFNASGVLQEEIGCGGCLGGSTFGKPVSVAIDSDNDLYVADLSPDRVVKLSPSGGTYVYASQLQSGLGAAAVGVDPADDTVFVGDLPGGGDYHVVAYNSSGTQIDDFGGGLFTKPEAPFGILVAPQIAANATTRKVYVGDVGKFYVFNRVTSQSPTVSIMTAGATGQVTATMRASVNPHTHTVLECKFEYTDDADFQANEFANADTLPCPKKPSGSVATVIEGKVAGLSPGTVYHYRQKTATFPGSATSSGQTFQTLPTAPATVTTESPASVTQTGAMLKGKVNPHGGSVSSCRFEFGTTTSYGTNFSCTPPVEPVSSDVTETRSITSLASGTTYHYRLVVTSNAGTTQGGDVAFTTTSPTQPGTEEPPATAPPAAGAPLPPIVTPPQPKPLTCKKGFRKKKVRGKLRCVKRKRHAKHRRRTSGANR